MQRRGAPLVPGQNVGPLFTGKLGDVVAALGLVLTSSAS